MNYRVAAMAVYALTVMVLITACLGPGVGIEANCVTLQTCGKTVTAWMRDLANAVRLGFPR